MLSTLQTYRLRFRVLNSARLSGNSVLTAILALCLCACANTPNLTASGPNRASTLGQFGRFAAAYDLALASPTNINSRNLLEEGFSLIYDDCIDYFRNEGQLQTTLNIVRDTSAFSGAIAAGVIAVARASKDAAAIAALTVTGVTGGVTIANANFLFGVDQYRRCADVDCGGACCA